MDVAVTLPQYTSSGLKSTPGIHLDPSMTIRALRSKLALQENSLIIHRRRWPMSVIHWRQVFSQKLSNSLRIGGCQRGLRIALTNDFGASEAMADDMRNLLMKIPKCMLVIVLTGTFEHSPVTKFQYWTCPYW